jgi:hypothetical protein
MRIYIVGNDGITLCRGVPATAVKILFSLAVSSVTRKVATQDR